MAAGQPNLDARTRRGAYDLVSPVPASRALSYAAADILHSLRTPLTKQEKWP